MVAYTFHGENGEQIERGPIPTDALHPLASHGHGGTLIELCNKMREEMLDGLSLVNDELAEAMLEDKVTPGFRNCLRDSTSRSSARP